MLPRRAASAGKVVVGSHSPHTPVLRPQPCCHPQPRPFLGGKMPRTQSIVPKVTPALLWVTRVPTLLHTMSFVHTRVLPINQGNHPQAPGWSLPRGFYPFPLNFPHPEGCRCPPAHARLSPSRTRAAFDAPGRRGSRLVSHNSCVG